MHYFYGIKNSFFYQFKVDDSYSIPTAICAFANLVLKNHKILGYSFYCNYSNLSTFIKKEIKSICINDTS